MPDDRECDIPPVVNPAVVCPADSDLAGMPMPDGDLAKLLATVRTARIGGKAR